MRLDRFQLQLFHQRFQFQRIQLLFTTLVDIVINKIDQVPDEKIHHEVHGGIDDQQKPIVEVGFFLTVQQFVFRQQCQIQISAHHTEQQREDEKNIELGFQLALKQVDLENKNPHQVGEDDSQHEKDADTAKKDRGFVGGG